MNVFGAAPQKAETAFRRFRTLRRSNRGGVT